jgi:hypothetical protein
MMAFLYSGYDSMMKQGIAFRDQVSSGHKLTHYRVAYRGVAL